MAQEFKPGEIVPQSGVYRITHDTRSGQREQLSLGWEGRKPLDTE